MMKLAQRFGSCSVPTAVLLSFAATSAVGFVMGLFLTAANMVDPLWLMAYVFAAIPVQFLYALVSILFFSRGTFGYFIFASFTALVISVLMQQEVSYGYSRTDGAQMTAGIVQVGCLALLAVVYFALVWFMAFRGMEKSDA